MVKCSKAQIRQLKTVLHWKIPPAQRQRIQMVLLRESGMTQPAIAAAMGVSLSTVNRAHMAYEELVLACSLMLGEGSRLARGRSWHHAAISSDDLRRKGGHLFDSVLDAPNKAVA